MTYEIQTRIQNDINLKRFLRENSYWYKQLNRNDESFRGFVEDMKSRSVMDQSVKDTMENYSVMTEAAQSSAIKQIEIIAKAATGNKKEVVVSFKEGQADEK